MFIKLVWLFLNLVSYDCIACLCVHAYFLQAIDVISGVYIKNSA